jgi:molybdopterin synthase sulfur carrier subunit
MSAAGTISRILAKRIVLVGWRSTVADYVDVVARVSFAKAIQRHAACPAADIPGDTLRAVLVGYFEAHPAARSYVLDERGSVRKHVAVFVNDTLVLDREQLSDPIAADDRVSVFQALSGGTT